MLADYLLANRSALSKELRKMERDGFITVNGRKIELLYQK
jgi:DNA-binding MarR family transcriptional regulator